MTRYDASAHSVLAFVFCSINIISFASIQGWKKYICITLFLLCVCVCVYIYINAMLSFLKNMFYWLCYYSCPICPPFTPLHPAYLLLPTFSPFSSCPWVIHIRSLASTFPTLFLPSPCLFSTYHLCYLFSVPFPPSPLLTPPLTTLHVISISMVLFLF